MSLEHCIDLLKAMTAIPSASQNEAGMARFLECYLREELGMETQIQPVEGTGGNVIGRWPCGRAPSRMLILGGHLDTVAPEAGWAGDPYRLRQRDGQLYGLGASDMKGGLAAQLAVLKRIHEEGLLWNAQVQFVGLADEERHSAGANAYASLVRAAGGLPQDVFFLMAEPHFDNLVIGATGKILLSLQVEGQAGHAARPETGINAVDCMAGFLCALQERYAPRYASGECASLCCLKIDGGDAAYSLTIPTRCTCLLNKQLLPTEQVGEFLLELQQLYQETVGRGSLTIRTQIPSYPAYRIDPEEAHLKGLLSFLKRRFGREPELRINQSVSDANILYHELGIPTVLYGPQGAASHTKDEHVGLDSLSAYMDELYEYLKEEYCGQPRSHGEGTHKETGL